MLNPRCSRCFQRVLGSEESQNKERLPIWTPCQLGGESTLSGSFARAIDGDSLQQCVSVIVKTGGDLRQEQLAVQLIQLFEKIWKQENVLCWVR